MQNHVSSADRRAMNELLDDATEKGWTVLDRYTEYDGWMMGNVCEFVVLRKGRGVRAEVAQCIMQRSPGGNYFMRKHEAGGHGMWHAT